MHQDGSGDSTSDATPQLGQYSDKLCEWGFNQELITVDRPASSNTNGPQRMALTLVNESGSAHDGQLVPFAKSYQVNLEIAGCIITHNDIRTGGCPDRDDSFS